MRIRQLDHVAIHVRDVAASRAFYGGVLGLREMPRPDFDFDGAWYAIGDRHELHLIGDRTKPPQSDPRGTHFAIEVADIQEAAEFLSGAGIEFDTIRTRPDGARQIFFQDPDGHWIEYTQLPG